ncbi:microtubule associated protein (MAP65/ASE1) family protein [Actinidia rufa]|uniref:Microtubule associated protein (MAP65/ASE1) family protein n=1 Tax=Actinidia rufa TaxID=165716 RepID=A0A7J0EV47_9ERIC|nr:microtubule associated protein (MAP65/ASE1) family protein [Actinidia rufa]
MVEALTSKATAWEKERGIEFSYDGVHLLSMLENYSIFKQEKEQECQRQRDQKKLQGQLLAEQEVLFGSKPSPSKSGNKLSRTSSIGSASSRGSKPSPSKSGNKLSRTSLIGGASSRRMSLGGAMLQASNPEKAAFPCHPLRKSNSVRQHNSRNHLLPSGSFLDLSSGGLNAKQHRCNASNARETKSQRIRKPLSPVNSALSYKSSTPNIQDLSRKTPSTNRTPVMSPAEIISTIDDCEHKTPRTMPVLLPNTPPTMSVAMQTTMTTPCVPGGAEDVEYSFEERRASFVLSK